MTCLVPPHSRPCAQESAYIDPISPGKVRDDEYLCRAGYKIHDHKGSPRLSLIRSKDLATGELSVWRLESSSSPKLADLVSILQERGPPDLLWVFGVPAKDLREIMGDCPLCAIDNTDCGWGRHPDHCVLAGCKALGFSDEQSTYDSTAFLSVRRALHETFKKNVIWTAAAAN